MSPALQQKVPYDTLRDFAPIGRLVVNSQIIVAQPAFPAASVADLVKAARAKPGSLTYASAGVGSPQHLGMEMLKARAKIDLLHVPYKGGGPAMTDLLAGRVQIYMASIPGMLPFIKEGKLKVLGVAGIERSSVFPNTPTVAEQVPGYEFVGTWYGMLTQTRVSPAIIARINGILNAALQTPEMRQMLISQGSDPRPMSVEGFAKFVQSDCPQWAQAVRMAGLKPE